MPPARWIGRAAGIAAIIVVLALVLLFSIRQCMEPDLGYHLAYGEEFLDHGTLVDTNACLYTLPDPATPPDQRPAPGPGCWYDRQGTYRFPNANWLTQVLLAFTYRHLGGAGGLCALRALLVAATFAVCLIALRRLRVGWLVCALGLLLATLASYERFYLRPELLSFLILAGQFALLLSDTAAASENRKALSWRALAGLTLLQLLMVNVHSYFLLGLALTGAVLTDRLLRLIWARLKDPRRQAEPLLKRSAVRLGLALLAQALVCFVNPWTWRIAILPFQTLAFLRKNAITTYSLTGHPWALIGEFERLSSQHSLPVLLETGSLCAWAYLVLLILAGVGGLAAAARRRWDWLLMLAGMTAVSWQMRRNIAPASLVVVPVALGAMTVRLPARLREILHCGRRKPVLELTALGAILAVASWSTHGVLTQRLYVAQTPLVRFGAGLSPLQVPLGAARWLVEHRPTGRIWTDYYCSSNVYYFSGCGYPVNILTNTWAYPPEVLGDMRQYTRALRPFADACARFGPEIVVVRVSAAAPVASRLARDENWRLVFVEGEFSVFLRADGPNAALAKALALSPAMLEADAFARRLEALDPLPQAGLSAGAINCFFLGWMDPAIDLYERALAWHERTGRFDGPYRKDLEMLAYAYMQRADSRALAGLRDQRCRQDWEEAQRVLLRLRKAEPGNPSVEPSLKIIRQELQKLPLPPSGGQEAPGDTIPPR